MFKKTLSAVLAVVMLVAVFAMALPASADTTSVTPTLENLYEYDGDGVANTESAGGPVGNNGNSQYNYVTAKNIPVAAGDKIYIGPILQKQGYHMVTYAADGTPVTLQVKTSDANIEIIPMNAIDPNTSILCYTVPEGVASITPVISQIFKHYAVITKNVPFTPHDYINYWEAKDVNITALIGGGTYALDPTVIKDVFAASTPTVGEWSNTKGTNKNYYATDDLIPVKEGDVVYFVGGSADYLVSNKAQGWHLALYDENGNFTTKVTRDYSVQYDDLGNGIVIYAYRVRGGTGYMRVNMFTPIVEAGLALATVNQPFTEKTLRMYAAKKGVAADTVDGLFGTYDILMVGSKNIGSSNGNPHVSFENIIEASFNIKVNVTLMQDSAYAANMFATETEANAIALNENLAANDYDVIILHITRRCSPSADDVEASELAAMAKLVKKFKAETNEIYLFIEYGEANASIFTTDGGVVNYTKTDNKESKTTQEMSAYFMELGRKAAAEFDCGYVAYADVHMDWIANGLSRSKTKIGYAMGCAMYNTVFGKIPASCEYIHEVDVNDAALIRSFAEGRCYTPFPTEAVDFGKAPVVTPPEEPEVTTPEATEPEATTPEATEPSVTPPTSDKDISTVVIVVAVAILSIACALSIVAVKKKEN